MIFEITDNTLTDIIFDDLTETKIVIPDGVKHIDIFPYGKEHSYIHRRENTPPICEIHIPSSVQAISGFSFRQLTGELLDIAFPTLEKVYFYGTLEQWCELERGSFDPRDGLYFEPDGLDHFDLYLQNDRGEFYLVRSILFDDEKQVIKHGTFYGCKSLTTVEFFHSAFLGSIAFENCTNLRTIIVHGSVLSFYDDFDPYDDEGTLVLFSLPNMSSLSLMLSKSAAIQAMENDSFDDPRLLETDIAVILIDSDDIPDIDLKEAYHHVALLLLLFAFLTFVVSIVAAFIYQRTIQKLVYRAADHFGDAIKAKM